MYFYVFSSAASIPGVMHLNVGLYLEVTATLLWRPLERDFSIQENCSILILLSTMFFNSPLAIVTDNADLPFDWPCSGDDYVMMTKCPFPRKTRKDFPRKLRSLLWKWHSQRHFACWNTLLLSLQWSLRYPPVISHSHEGEYQCTNKSYSLSSCCENQV